MSLLLQIFLVLGLVLSESHVMLVLVLPGLHGLHGHSVLSPVEEDPEPGSESAGREGTMETVLERMKRRRLVMMTSVLPGQNGQSGHSAPSPVEGEREQR